MPRWNSSKVHVRWGSSDRVMDLDSAKQFAAELRSSGVHPRVVAEAHDLGGRAGYLTLEGKALEQALGPRRNLPWRAARVLLRADGLVR